MKIPSFDDYNIYVVCADVICSTDSDSNNTFAHCGSFAAAVFQNGSSCRHLLNNYIKPI
jgi:hypothetical protein